MNKKEILEQYFTDVEIEDSRWFFTYEGKKLEIIDYTYSNLVVNASRETLKNEILERAENEAIYYVKHSELQPTIRLFRIRDTAFSTGEPTQSIQRFSWDFENWQGVTDKDTRAFLADPEKLKTYATQITRQEAKQIIKDVLYTETITDNK